MAATWAFGSFSSCRMHSAVSMRPCRADARRRGFDLVVVYPQIDQLGRLAADDTYRSRRASTPRPESAHHRIREQLRLRRKCRDDGAIAAGRRGAAKQAAAKISRLSSENASVSREPCPTVSWRCASPPRCSLVSRDRIPPGRCCRGKDRSPVRTCFCIPHVPGPLSTAFPHGCPASFTRTVTIERSATTALQAPSHSRCRSRTRSLSRPLAFFELFGIQYYNAYLLVSVNRFRQTY